MVTLVSVGLLAVGIAYVVWTAWRKHQPDKPPWAMREFHRRMDHKPPHEGSENVAGRDD